MNGGHENSLGAAGRIQQSRPQTSSSVAPVPIRMQDIQAAIANSSQYQPQMSTQHPYFSQAMMRPGVEGAPVQGFQQLLGAQQLTQYHQRGLLQGQQSKAAMGQQGVEKPSSSTRTGFTLGPLSSRPLPTSGAGGQYSGSQLNLAPLPSPSPYLSLPQAGSQPWGLPQSLAAQREGHAGSAFQQASTRTLDLSAGGITPHSQNPLAATPMPSSSTPQPEGGSLPEEGMPGAEANPLQAYPEGAMILEHQHTEIPGADLQSKSKRNAQMHFIPPGSAVIQPGPPMIHPGSTYNDAVSLS